MTGIEPARLAALDPKSSMSTSSTTSADLGQSYIVALGRQIYIIVIFKKAQQHRVICYRSIKGVCNQGCGDISSVFLVL